MKEGPVNQYGYPLGGCLFGTMVAGRSAHSQRCACANCGMWRQWRVRVFNQKRRARMERARARRSA